MITSMQKFEINQHKKYDRHFEEVACKKQGATKLVTEILPTFQCIEEIGICQCNQKGISLKIF